MILTFVACGPFVPSPSSNSTFAPSASVRKPSPAIPEKWTNASLLPSSGGMNPKPFSSLNHLTTPVTMRHSSVFMHARGVLPALPSRIPPCRPKSGRTGKLYQASSMGGSLRASPGVGRRVLGLRRPLRRRLVLVRVERPVARRRRGRGRRGGAGRRGVRRRGARGALRPRDRAAGAAPAGARVAPEERLRDERSLREREGAAVAAVRLAHVGVPDVGRVRAAVDRGRGGRGGH